MICLAGLFFFIFFNVSSKYSYSFFLGAIATLLLDLYHNNIQIYYYEVKLWHAGKKYLVVQKIYNSGTNRRVLYNQVLAAMPIICRLLFVKQDYLSSQVQTGARFLVVIRLQTAKTPSLSLVSHEFTKLMVLKMHF